MKLMGYQISSFWHFAIAAVAFWAGMALFTHETKRTPASSTTEIHDLSGLDTKEFKEKAIVKIIEGTDLIRGNETYRIRLGHIYGPDRSVSMCETYKSIVIVMKADGISTSHGNSPSITMKFPCAAEKSARQTNEVVLPYKEITQSKAEDSEFDYEGTKILASYIDSEWPWQLYIDSISLVGGDGLHISLSDIRRIKRGNFNLNF